jgi:choline dehydrogenase-like flavoprotein
VTVRSAATLDQDTTITCDVCVIGSGAGGAIAAATLAAAGARVVLLEEGGHHTRRDFNLQESWAYPAMYQEHGNRTTEDLSILILQGRTVGGGTTVNWTSSFRVPERTTRLWADRHGVSGIDAMTLAPHYDAVEARLNVGPGNPDDVNANNRKLLDGARRLGWDAELIRRSVKGCARLGYCGMGCPLDAKQSALVTYVADAVAAGADLFSDCRVTTVELDGRRARRVIAEALDRAPDRPTGRRLVVEPRRGVVVAAGAINTPALLLRSKLGNGSVGRRTFLHPTVPIVGVFDERIEGFYGPPQSVACHTFADRGERVGFFFETAPVHPMLAAIALPGFGGAHRARMQQLAHAQATIALLVDGHHEDEGGTVSLTRSGRVKLAYPIGAALVEAARTAIGNMAHLLLAAGAREVVSLHTDPVVVRRESDLPALEAAPFGPNQHTLFSAHQMGGCAMGDDARRAVVTSRGRLHDADNVWVCDGSVFPTSLGVNPQLTIYALARLFATELARAG